VKREQGMRKVYGTACSVFLISLLTACGGSGSNKSVEITNQAPTAKIEIDASTITLDESVAINGSSSTDIDGDTLTYQWSIQNAAGEDYVLENSVSETFQFTPSKYGNYKVSLVVRDEKLSSKSVSSTIVVEPNEASYPIARTSGDMSRKVGSVTWFSALDSTASVDQTLTYQWTLKSQPMLSSSVISDEDKVKGFIITDVVGMYTILLTVTNSENQLTSTQEITLVADAVLTNSVPVAVISSPQSTYATNQLIKINATDSYDSDGTDLSYQWSLLPPATASNVTFTGSKTEFVEFNSDGVGEYILILEVSDGLLKHEVSKTIIVIEQNIAPVANAGSDNAVGKGINLKLDGVSSSDSDGAVNNLLFKWSLVSKPQASNYNGLESLDFVRHSHFDFVGDVVGYYVFGLQVFDGTDYSALDTVYVEVSDNLRPVAVLPADVIVHQTGSSTLLQTQSFDPEGQPLRYKWSMVSVPSGSTGQIVSPVDLESVSVMKDVPGTYTFQLIVNDGFQDSLPATMSFIYTTESAFEVTVKGRFVDHAGLPLEIAEIGGIFHVKLPSDSDGNFEITLKSRKKDASLTVITLADESILSFVLRVPHTEDSQMDVGTITLPILQQKDVSLVACEGYTGPEKISVHFYLSTDGYENMKFLKPVAVELTLNQEAITVRLPATGVINLRLASSTSGQISVNDNQTYFTHQYQTDDTQSDPLLITVCN